MFIFFVFKPWRMCTDLWGSVRSSFGSLVMPRGHDPHHPLCPATSFRCLFGCVIVQWLCIYLFLIVSIHAIWFVIHTVGRQYVPHQKPYEFIGISIIMLKHHMKLYGFWAWYRDPYEFLGFGGNRRMTLSENIEYELKWWFLICSASRFCTPTQGFIICFMNIY